LQISEIRKRTIDFIIRRREKERKREREKERKREREKERKRERE
jgi:hypothetical protein